MERLDPIKRILLGVSLAAVGLVYLSIEMTVSSAVVAVLCAAVFALFVDKEG